MSKRVRALLIVLAAAVVLAGAVCAMVFFGGGQEEDTQGTEPTMPQDIPLLEKDKDASGELVASPVKELTVSNALGEYRIAPREDGSLSVDAYPDLPADTMAIRSMCTNFSSLSALSSVTGEEAASAYGLDPPAATVTAVFHDDTSATVCFGGKTPYETGYYARLEGEATVYIIETGVSEQFLLSSALSLIGKTLIGPPSVDADDNEGTAQLLELRLTGTDRDQPVAITVDTDGAYGGLTRISTYVMTTPYVRAVDADKLAELSQAMCSLTASEAVAAHPDDRQLEDYGLLKPASSAAFTLSVVKGEASDDGGTSVTHYNDREHMVLLGNTDEEGNYYALVDGIDVVYRLSPESVPWAKLRYIDLTSKLLFLRDITDVRSLTVSDGGVSTAFTLTHHPDKSDKDEQMTVTSGGKSYNTAEFRKLYQLLIGIHRVADAEPDAKADGVPVMSLKAEFTDGSAPMTLSLYPMTASRYLCVTDDGERTAVSISNTDDFFRQYRRYLAGEPVVTPN